MSGSNAEESAPAQIIYSRADIYTGLRGWGRGGISRLYGPSDYGITSLFPTERKLRLFNLEVRTW